MKPVAVVHEPSLQVVERFETLETAEQFIAALPDRLAVERGDYGIDAPEEMVNP